MMHAPKPLSEFAFDMRRHFEQKLDALMHDTLDTCCTGGTTPIEGVTVLASPLMNAVCDLMLAVGCSEGSLIEIMQASYRRAQIMHAKDDHRHERRKQ